MRDVQQPANPYLRVIVALGAVVAMLCGIAWWRTNATRGGNVAAAAVEPSLPPFVGTHACAPELSPIESGACWGAPTMHQDAPVIVYFHGRYDKALLKEELERQGRLAKRALAKGYAVLALPGEQGACHQPDMANWICYPLHDNTAGEVERFMASWRGAFDRAARESRGPRYVLGFSNGGYFAGLLATRYGMRDVRAYAIAGAGSVASMPITQPVANAPPVLLLTGDDDPSAPDTAVMMGDLSRMKWPYDAYARAGTHMLAEGDIDAALTFFERSGRESLPLSPPIASMHRPRAPMQNPSTLDAGPDGGESPPTPINPPPVEEVAATATRAPAAATE